MFGNLTYNNKVIKPSLQPVEAIAGMYDVQTKSYEYAVDNYNKAQTLLSNIPVDKNTKHVVMGAQDVLNQELDKIAQKGDYENYALNSKQLTADLANKHGLGAVQNYVNQVSAYDKTLAETEGLTPARAAEYKRDAERRTQPLRYDPDLKRWIGGYNARTPMAQKNWSKELLDVTDNFKANTLPFTADNGDLIIRNAEGTGYKYSTTGEAVTEKELLEFSRNYLANDPQFQAELQEDLYLETGNLLYDEETGTQRRMTGDDIKRVFPNRYIEMGREMFGLGKGDIETELNDKGIAPEQFYSAIKAEEKMNLAARPAVLKESYEKYTNDFLKIGDGENGDGSGTGEIAEYLKFGAGIVDTYSVEDRNTAEDLEVSAKLMSAATTRAAELDAELATIDNPYLIQQNRKAKAEQTRLIESTIDKHSQNLNLVPEIKNKVESLVASSGKINKLDPNNTIPGLDISMVSMQKLIYKSMAGEDISTELDQYINETALKDYTETLRSPGVTSARESNLPNTDPIGNLKRVSKNRLRKTIEGFAEELKESADNGQIKYTESYTSFNLAEMDSKTKLAHPAYQIDNAANNMSKQSSSFYRKFTHPTGLDVETYIKEELDLKALDAIDWENVIVSASIDAARGQDGTKKPTVKMQIPVKLKDGVDNITIQAFVDEPTYNAAYFETIQTLQKDLTEKKNTVGLKPSEQLVLDRYNANLFDTSKYGTTFPTNQLYNAKHNDLVEFDFMDNAEKAKVRVSTKGSVNGYGYFLVDNPGNNPEDDKYWVRDSSGQEMTVSKAELSNPKYTPIGGNTPYDLRVMMGEMTSSSNSGGMTNDVIDLTTIFKTDIKTGVIPKISKEVAPYAQNLKSEFPGLIITDALRPKDAGYGAEDSLHKVAKALDFRLNDDGRKLLALSDREKRLFGIKEVGLHNGNHIHLEFL